MIIKVIYVYIAYIVLICVINMHLKLHLNSSPVSFTLPIRLKTFSAVA